MNSNEIEEKLEKDSITIKEQILNLQNTIKKLKTDMIGSNQFSQIPKQTDINREDKSEEQCQVKDAYNNGTFYNTNHYNDNNIDYGAGYEDRDTELEKDHHLKFSFNQNAQMHNRSKDNTNQLKGNNSFKALSSVNNDYNNNLIPTKGNNHDNQGKKKFINNDDDDDDDDYNERQDKKYNYVSKKNFYQENISKIRQENNLIHQMERVKEDIKPQKERYLYKNTFTNNNNKPEVEEDNDSDSDDTFDKVFMQNKNTKIEDKYKNMDLNNIRPSDGNPKVSIANKIRQEEEDYNSKCNIGSAKGIKYMRESDIDEDSGNELQLEDLTKETKKNNELPLYQEKNKETDDSFLLDDAIKKLQKKGFTCIKSTPEQKIPTTKNINNTNNTNNKKKKSIPQKGVQDKQQIHLQSLRTNNTQRPKSTQKISSQKYKSSSNIVIANSKTSNTTLTNNTPITTNTNTNINYNTNNNCVAGGPNQLKEIKSYQLEINNLKSNIMKLKTENEKLKSSLQKERTQNAKYKELTEEIIRHYEKTKRPLINS